MSSSPHPPLLPPKKHRKEKRGMTPKPKPQTSQTHPPLPKKNDPTPTSQPSSSPPQKKTGQPPGDSSRDLCIPDRWFGHLTQPLSSGHVNSP